MGKLEIIQILFSNDLIDVNMPSENEGYTALMVALYKGYYEVTKFLLENNADVGKITKSGHYPILFCFSRLEDDKYKYENRTLCMLMIDLMLSKGADINIRVDNNPGFNILMKLVSAEINDEESFQSTVSIIKFLIERGADKQMTTFNGISLIETIKSKMYSEQLINLINTTNRVYFYNVNKNSLVNSKVSNASDKKVINSIDMDSITHKENCCNIL